MRMADARTLAEGKFVFPRLVATPIEPRDCIVSCEQAPTPYTSVGAEGPGESGTIGAFLAVVNVVNRGLNSLGSAEHHEPPYIPQKMGATIEYLTRNSGHRK